MLNVVADAPLAEYTRFAIGGPAALLCDTAEAKAFCEALRVVRESAAAHAVIGAGSNLIVSDQGFDGVVLRFAGNRIDRMGVELHVEAGAMLQDVVDQSIGWGLKGMETMTGIPGYLGAAIYGNAGAYGHSIQERVESVAFTDGSDLRRFDNQQCEFGYRHSIFKDRKDWIILSADLGFESADGAELAEKAQSIRAVRDEKYPPAMKCAGSIFKNVFHADLPRAVQELVPSNLIRDGKIPSAWFLEQVGAKGIRKGDIQVATYHANLIYNRGAGTASDLVDVIASLKAKVRDRFGFDLEEEVQYVGFEFATAER